MKKSETIKKREITKKLKDNKEKKVPVVSKNKNAPASNYLTKLIIMIIIVFLLGVYITYLFYVNYKIIDYKVINTSVKIQASGAGFNVDKESLNFGKNYPGGGGQRFFQVRSVRDVIVRMYVTGEMSRFLIFSENDFLLKANEIKRVDVNLEVPEDTAIGNYTGKIKIYFLRP